MKRLSEYPELLAPLEAAGDHALALLLTPAIFSLVCWAMLSVFVLSRLDRSRAATPDAVGNDATSDEHLTSS